MDRNVKLGVAIVIISVLVIVMGFLANGWRPSGIDSSALKDFFKWENVPEAGRLAKSPGSRRKEKILKARGETRGPVRSKKSTARETPPAATKKFLRIDPSGGPDRTRVETIHHAYRHRLAEVREAVRPSAPESETFRMNEEERELYKSQLDGNPELASRNRARATGVSEQSGFAERNKAADRRPSTVSPRRAHQAAPTPQLRSEKARGASGGQTYTVVKGDYLIKISTKVYGEKRHWRKIYEANRKKFPRNSMQVRPGMTLFIPKLNSGRAAKAASPRSPKAKLYKIKESDTLTKIAVKHYKDPKKWVVIYRANKDVISDPDILISGTTIRLP